MNADSSTEAEAQTDTMILFVTGDSPRSQRARANLSRALEQAGMASDQAREIDLLKQPEKVTEYRIFATPALLGGTDADQAQVLYGDLSDQDKLNEFLRRP